jgi:hypothetical protein
MKADKSSRLRRADAIRVPHLRFFGQSKRQFRRNKRTARQRAQVAEKSFFIGWGVRVENY